MLGKLLCRGGFHKLRYENAYVTDPPMPTCRRCHALVVDRPCRIVEEPVIHSLIVKRGGSLDITEQCDGLHLSGDLTFG